MSAPELLKKRLAEWETLYEHELNETELALWYDTFRDLRISDVLLEAALRIVPSKVFKMPKPAHLTMAIEEVRAQRDRDSRGSVLEDMQNTPHISELPASERAEMKQIFDRAVAQILDGQLPKYPHARTWKDQKVEVERQKRAFAASQSDANQVRDAEHSEAPSGSQVPAPSTPAIAVQPAEIAPEDLAEEVPFVPSDEDIPW